MRRLCLPVLLLATAVAAADPLPLFTHGDVSNWEYQSFDDIPETTYRQITTEDGDSVLQAEADGSASGFIMRRELSLSETPWLHFRWRVLQAGSNAAEKTRAGDDFAWRLYFVGKSGLEYRTLNLVIAHNAAAGESWESPYAGFLRDIRLVAAATHRDQDLGQWQTTTLNVGALWRDAFGEDSDIGLIGLMTDSDNTGTVMQVQYDSLFLSASEEL